MLVVIITPTYNEALNIKPFILSVFSVVKEIRGFNFLHLIVDDNSPDHTASIVKDLTLSHQHVHLISGEKKGLGAAYKRGMKYAMDSLGADAVMEMDADFSHDPKDIVRFTKEAAHADFIIGSRYVKGGNIPKNWGLFRKLNSKFGNIFARYVAGLYPTKDCTAGFRFIKCSILKEINFDVMQGKGYCFQINLLYQAKILGAQIVEIPVTFIDRTKGESKLGLKDVIEFFLLIWLIRLHSSQTFIKFSLVGLSGVFVNLGFFSILLKFELHTYLASLISIELSIISNFLLNNFWTFGRVNKKNNLPLRGLLFNFVSLISLLLSFESFLILSNLFPHLSLLLVQFISIFPAMFVNYFLNAYWTFRKSKEK